MKIRAINLKNVRRFQGVSASISGIADGITTICAPNESGKSTFFDALHAIFFYAHTGQSQEVKSLQPYSKGPVEISVDVEDDNGHPYRIDKTYLASKSATITDLKSGQIIAQADEAELWIQGLIGDGASGPAGLLWVRQGITGSGPEGTGAREKTERDNLRETRQDLMSTITGQIDNVTGGQRMDRIMKSCIADHDALATKAGAPKAGGEWHKVAKRAEELTAEESRLDSQVSELSEALREYSELKSIERRADKENAGEKRNIDIQEAEKTLKEAQSHAGQIESAKRDVKYAGISLKSAQDKIDASKATKQAHENFKSEQSRLSQAHDEAQKDYEAAALTFQKDDTALKDVEKSLSAAREALAEGRKQIDRRGYATRRKDLNKLIDTVKGHQKDRQTQQDILNSILLTQGDMDELLELNRNLIAANSLRDATAGRLRLSYESKAVSALLTSDGTELPDNEDVSLSSHISIALPGIGTMSLTPGAMDSKEGDAPADIEKDIAALLARVKLADIEAARSENQRRIGAENAIALAKNSIDTLAPEGIDAQERALAELGEDDQEGIVNADIDVEALEKAVRKAERQHSEAQTKHAGSRAARDESDRSKILANTRYEMAKEAYESHEDSSLSDDEYQRISGEIETARKAQTELDEKIENLEVEAPDVGAAEAELERLTSVRDNAIREREARVERINILSGTIRARSEDDVEARLAEVRGQLERASERAARYKFEVDTLRTLRDHLTQARQSARDAYFEPIKKELLPLISILHDRAEITMNPDTMLPEELVRDGQVDAIDNLSGGAAEQIAILTRLAFARLYSKAGRSIPVILDDALVHSDDERITQMFTALTKLSKDQQIIVLSCRTRAFEDLGGTRATIETEARI